MAENNGGGVGMGIVAALAAALGRDPAVIAEAVAAWLDEHPEATTTVEDGSITYAKLAEAVAAKLDEIDGLSEAITYVAPKDPVTIPFIDNTLINSSGVAETDNNHEATDYIDLDGIVAIAYTGKCGSIRSVFWYDDEKNFLSYSLMLNDRTAWFENIMVYKPDDAAYVRIQSKKLTASNPPDIAPEVTAYLDDKYIDVLKAGIVGDGVTDDTLAVQKIVNMCDVVFPKRDTILISRPIDIRLGYARIIDGNGCGIIVDDDFCALSVTGTLDTASDATRMDAFVVKHEACTLIENFRITAQDTTEGCGIELTKGFKTKLCNNYIHHMKNGIRVYGRNRDVIISENNIFAHIQNGILFDQGVNLHQCNIVNNMIQYAHDNIHIYHPSAIANFQIVGNDIEIDQFPASTYATATCINFESYASTSQFSEIEISGNTIQGHQTGQDIIVLAGVDDHEIKHMAITGNHISNGHGHGINMAYIENASISGNNYAVFDDYVYGMDGECTNIVISGESAESVGGKIKAESTATLNGIKCKNVRFLTNDRNSILTNDVTDVDIYDEKDIPVTGTTPSITAVPNARYICGEVSTLSFTPCADGVCEVIFTSGQTPTTLTIPNTVKWSDANFDPSDLDADKNYLLKVAYGTMGIAQAFEYVSPSPGTIGGLPVYADNCYYPKADGAVDSVTANNDYFLVMVDMESSGTRDYTYSKIGVPTTEAALRLFASLDSTSADYYTVMRTDITDGQVQASNLQYGGRYLVFSVYKPYAANFYLKYKDGDYIIKGDNVT